MNKPVIRIIIADDHGLFINGLQLLLKNEERLEIVDIASDGKELLEILQKGRLPDIILLDINMPRINGLEAIRHIKQAYAAIKIIILSTYNEEHIIAKAKDFGVNGYLLKTSSKEELLLSIDLVMNNHTAFPYRPPQQKNLFAETDNFLKQFNLTNREMEIILLIKEGHTNQQIADQLFLSVFTIETHRKNIMKKLELKKTAELIKFIYQHQL